MQLNRSLPTLLTLACLLPAVPANGMLRNIIKLARRAPRTIPAPVLHTHPNLNNQSNRFMSVASAGKTGQSSGGEEKRSYTGFGKKAALGASLVALAGTYHLHEDEQRLRNTSTAGIEAKWTDATSDICAGEAEVVFAAMTKDSEYAQKVAQALIKRFQKGITTDKELRLFIIACKFSPVLAVALTELVCKSSNNLNRFILKTILYASPRLPTIYTDERERVVTYKECIKLVDAYDQRKQKIKAEQVTAETAEKSER